MNPIRGDRQMREKLPWYLLLAALFAVLAWRTHSTGAQPTFVPGAVLLCTAAARIFLSLRLEDARRARREWLTGAIGAALGLVLVRADHFSRVFLEIALLGWLALCLLSMLRPGRPSASTAPRVARTVAAVAAVAAGAALMLDPRRAFVPVTIGVVLGELVATAFRLAVERWRPWPNPLVGMLQTSTGPEPAARYAASAIDGEPIVRQSANAWLAVMVVVLFGTHLERMGFTGNLGVLPPLIALVGDLVVALLLGLVVILPFRVSLARLLGMHEGRFIAIVADSASRPIRARLARFLHIRHVRLKIRLTQAGRSLPALLRQGLLTGLPVVALLTAIVPLVGTNWFFNTEQWAAIARDQWSALNADTWRMKMVVAANPDPDRSLAVHVPGLEAGDFSFVVVGDTGQGGLSQRELAKRIVRTAEQDDVRFVLVSSDVVYPNGEMKDYEARFWSPFSGLSKPILAIPGNHDWYDGLDSFAATFFKPDAARAAIAARRDDGRADRLIAAAQTLGDRYGLTTRLQTAPYFKIEAGDFVLLCVETGVLARIDEMQMDWLRRALADARGKTKMVVLGHPFLAWNRDRTQDLPGLAPILDLLRREEVSIAMAGDIHDLEYYLDRSDPDHAMHHFVNGGGGAYLSLGRALGSPLKPMTEQWAYYPTRDAIVAKLDAEVPPLIRPFWWLAKKWEGHVWTGDRFSTALDQDRSPFLNSFLVVHVEASRKQVRIVPHGVHGRLTWSDFAVSADPKTLPQDYAEWSIPMSVPDGSPKDRPEGRR